MSLAEKDATPLAGEDTRATGAVSPPATQGSETRMSKPRLRRLRWLYTNHPLYFLTTCTAGRRRLLANAEIHAALIHFARRAEERGVWVGRYVIMPDHLHLFAGFGPSSPALPEWRKLSSGAWRRC